MQKGLLIYLIVMNLIGLAVMAMDKSKARHHAWRIPEKTFFKALVFCGGNAGDPDLTDVHCGIDLENAWVWDVIKAWFATAYTFFK